MPRRARMYVAGVPYHVVQRGNNREACFYAPDDYQIYLEIMAEVLGRYDVRLHAYVLMTNHVHLLMTPQDRDGISSVTKVLGSRFAQHMNKKYRRTGTMWEGRHKASAVESETYLLKCYRYIELNPVAASMVERPEEYAWSSYCVNAYGDESRVVEPHAQYLALGASSGIRCHRYREMFAEVLSTEDLHGIRRATHYCQPLGGDRFRAQIELKTGNTFGRMGRGRPRKADQK